MRTFFLRCLLIGFTLFTCILTLSGCRQWNSVSRNRYTIVGNLDYTEGTLQASMTVAYQNRTDMPLQSIQFHLYPNAFRSDARYRPLTQQEEEYAYYNGFDAGSITIQNVSCNARTQNFIIGGIDRNLLTVPLTETLYPQDNATIEMNFTLDIPQIRHRFGKSDHSINLGQWYPQLCVYDAQGYHTVPYLEIGDPFYSEMADYDVTLTMDADCVVAAPAACTETLESQQKTIHFTASGLRDCALVVSPEFSLCETTVEDTTVRYFYYQDAAPEEALSVAQHAIDTFSRRFGDYIYPLYTVVQTGFPNGGMEYSGLVYIADHLTPQEQKIVIAHETAHQWWYNAVGNDQVENAWLDEGLTEFSTLYFFEENPEFGIAARDLLASNKKSLLLYISVYNHVFQQCNLDFRRPLYSYNDSLSYVQNCYTAAMLLFDALRSQMGEENFFAALSAYYQAYCMQVAEPAGLFAAFDAYSVDSEAFIEQFIETYEKIA